MTWNRLIAGEVESHRILDVYWNLNEQTLLINCTWGIRERRVKNDSKECDLSNWKNGRGVYCEGEDHGKSLTHLVCPQHSAQQIDIAWNWTRRYGIIPAPARFPQTNAEDLLNNEFEPRNHVCFAWYFEHPNGSHIKGENAVLIWREIEFKTDILHKVSFFYNV